MKTSLLLRTGKGSKFLCRSVYLLSRFMKMWLATSYKFWDMRTGDLIVLKTHGVIHYCCTWNYCFPVFYCKFAIARSNGMKAWILFSWDVGNVLCFRHLRGFLVLVWSRNNGWNWNTMKLKFTYTQVQFKLVHDKYYA